MPCEGGALAPHWHGSGPTLSESSTLPTGPSRSHHSKLPGKLLLCGPSLFFFFHSLSKQCGLLANVTLLSLAAHPATSPSAVSDASPSQSDQHFPRRRACFIELK